MIYLDRHNLTQKLREAFIWDDVAFFSTSEGSQIDINDLFHMALKFGSNKIFRHALSMGANPHLKDCEGNSALYNVVSGLALMGERCGTSGLNLTKMFKELVNKYECDPREENENLLHIAVREGLQGIAEFLLDKAMFKVDEKESDGRTPLFEAVSKEKIFMAKMLLKRKANANEVSNSGMTPLWTAAYAKFPSPAMFDLLIEFKADPTTLYQGRKLVSYLWGQGNHNGHAAIIKHLKLDSHQVKEAIREEETRREAARKKIAEAEAARKQAVKAETARKKAVEAEATRKQAEEAEAARKEVEATRKQAERQKAEKTQDTPNNKDNNTEASYLTKAYNVVKRLSVLLAVVGATIAAVLGTVSPLWIFMGIFLAVEGAQKIREKITARAFNQLEKNKSISESDHFVENEKTESLASYFTKGKSCIFSSHHANPEAANIRTTVDTSQRLKMTIKN